MQIEINEIKHIRNKIGITQLELASASGVSQSLIAKIESGKLDPTYSNAVKIFDALKQFSNEKELKAKDVMAEKVISVNGNCTLKQTIKLMKEFNISQVPVISDNKLTGLISESIILEVFLEGRYGLVKDVMTDCPPIVSKETSISVVSNLLKFFPLVLVSNEGHFKGVITKSDLLGQYYQ